MLDYAQCRIERVAVHHVGNKTRDEGMILSHTLLDISDSEVRDLLQRFFLAPFEAPEFHTFTFSNGDVALNPMFNFAAHIFDHDDALQHVSVDIAKHLYDASVHSQVKPGDLFVAKFSNLRIEDEITDAIGIFKSENRQSFLKLDSEGHAFSIRCDTGISIDKLDKGCLIFDTDKNAGYRVCVVDRSNRSVEAQYWKDDFLQIRPRNDSFHHTKVYMNIAKDFVDNQLAEDFDITRADQIDLLNRSVNFFKSRENFNKNDFEEDVLQEDSVISSFRNYRERYKQEHDVEPVDSFDISAQAVKKHGRVFKSVLKLDKNFHIYIHGDRDLIEQGVDQNGRKYYKIYFEKES